MPHGKIPSDSVEKLILRCLTFVEIYKAITDFIIKRLVRINTQQVGMKSFYISSHTEAGGKINMICVGFTDWLNFFNKQVVLLYSR